MQALVLTTGIMCNEFGHKNGDPGCCPQSLLVYPFWYGSFSLFFQIIYKSAKRLKA